MWLYAWETVREKKFFVYTGIVGEAQLAAQSILFNIDAIAFTLVSTLSTICIDVPSLLKTFNKPHIIVT